MELNRETKRMLQRQGAINPDGSPTRAPRSAPVTRPTDEKPSPPEYIRQVQAELKKVNWPTRPEVGNFTAVVIVTLLIMTLLTFVFDLVFSKSVFFLFTK